MVFWTLSLRQTKIPFFIFCLSARLESRLRIDNRGPSSPVKKSSSFWTNSVRIFQKTFHLWRYLLQVSLPNVLHGLFWVWRIAIQRNAVLLLHLKTILRSIFPLNCSKEPFCNICERFEAERKIAVFSATSTMTFPATQTSCLFYCPSTPEFELKNHFFDVQLESRKKRVFL